MDSNVFKQSTGTMETCTERLILITHKKLEQSTLCWFPKVMNKSHVTMTNQTIQGSRKKGTEA